VKFDDERVDASGVDDLRGAGNSGGAGFSGGGSGGGGGGGAAGGILTLLISSGLLKRFGLPGLIIGGLLIVGLSVLGGSGGSPSGAVNLDPTQVSAAGVGAQTGTDLQTRCNTEGAIDKYPDCFMTKVFNETNEVWSKNAASQGITPFSEPRLVFFSGRVKTGCGPSTADMGPFYCPPDKRIYFDLNFLEQLQSQLGAQGQYAKAYIMAHEYGHHLQNITGIEPKVRQLQQKNPSQANALSVRMELQADCFAGVWGKLANDQGNLTVTPAEIAEAQRAAAAVGDDSIQKGAGQQVRQDTWTHGSAQQRQDWYNKGYAAGQISACNTFAG